MMKAPLSPREAEILNLIILEYTTIEIANELFLSRETVKTHRQHLLAKFSARNVAGLVRRAFEYQLVSDGRLKMLRN